MGRCFAEKFYWVLLIFYASQATGERGKEFAFHLIIFRFSERRRPTRGGCRRVDIRTKTGDDLVRSIFRPLMQTSKQEGGVERGFSVIESQNDHELIENFTFNTTNAP